MQEKVYNFFTKYSLLERSRLVLSEALALVEKERSTEGPKGVNYFVLKNYLPQKSDKIMVVHAYRI